jgi:hypothetical protein
MATKMSRSGLVFGTATALIIAYSAMAFSPGGVGMALPLVLGNTYMNSK